MITETSLKFLLNTAKGTSDEHYGAIIREIVAEYRLHLDERTRLNAEISRLRDMLDVSTRTLTRAHAKLTTSRTVTIPEPTTLEERFAARTMPSGVTQLPLETTDALVTIEMNGTPNDRPLYACSATGKLLRLTDTIDGGTGCAKHGGVPCVLVGYEQ